MKRIQKSFRDLSMLPLFTILLLSFYFILFRLPSDVLAAPGQPPGGGGNQGCANPPPCPAGATDVFCGGVYYVCPAYSQGSYYSQGGYGPIYTQGGYYAEGGYYGEGSYYSQATYCPADLIAYNFDLTDSSGTVKTVFHVGDRIYVRFSIRNDGCTPGYTANGRTYHTLYRDRPTQINSYNLGSDPSNFYLDTGIFYVGDAYNYGSYPSHPRSGQFPGVNYWTQAEAGSYTARVFVDYDGRVSESTNFGNNQATQNYTVRADITGRVAFDDNGDARYTTSDPGIENASVVMYKRSSSGNYDSRVGSRTTDSTGRYEFLDRTEGDYQITLTLPANYQMVSNNPRTTTLGGNKSINFLLKKFIISGSVFIDNDKDNFFDSIETGYTGGATVRLTGAGTGTKTTNSVGDYSFTELNEGNFAVHLTSPSDYDPTGPVSKNVSVNNADVTNVDFGIFPKYTISGSVFVDDDGDGVKDGNEALYARRPTIRRNGSTQFVTTNADGTFSAAGLVAGTYTITYESLPAGFFMVHPKNGTPPFFTVTVGPNCGTNPPLPAPPNGGASGTCNGSNNVTGLNFAIKPGTPWTQLFGLDVRFDGGIDNPIPETPNAACGGTYAIVKTGNAPGIFFTGDISSTFGQGEANERNFVVGGSTYPEEYAGAPGATTKTSYEYLSGVAKQSGITPTNIVGATGGCTSLSSCTATSSLVNGVYLANGNLTLNGFTAGANRDYVLLVNGNLTINGNITVPVGSTLTVSTKGMITVGSTVGATATCPAPAGQIQGFFSTDTSFIISSTNNTATERMLNMEGAIVVNASRTGGTFQNDRDLGTGNISFPVFTLRERPDMVLNAPTFIRSTSTIWQEVAP